MTNDKKQILGHLLACGTQIMWGATFVSTKILLKHFLPAEVLFTRAVLAFLLLLLFYPHRLKLKDKQQVILFAGAGLFGIVLYFMLENTALTMTYASNVGIIVACAPFFVAVIVGFFFKSEQTDLRSRINCKDIHLIPGNHDQDWSQPAVSWVFKVEEPICVLEIEKLKIILSHYPMADWQEMSHGSIHLHGHIHSKGMKYKEINRMQGLYRYDVGVDANDYRPICLDEILAWFKDIPYNGRATGVIG